MAASSEIRIAPLGAEGGAENRIGCQKKKGATSRRPNFVYLGPRALWRRRKPQEHTLSPCIRSGQVFARISSAWCSEIPSQK
jgi:hypothetical protein